MVFDYCQNKFKIYFYIFENADFWTHGKFKNAILTPSLRGSKNSVGYGDGTLLDQCPKFSKLIKTTALENQFLTF